jgi:hypothetical protein
MGLFGVLSVFGRRIKGMLRLGPEQVWTCNVNRVTYQTLRGHESRPHRYDTVLRYAVTLQACTHP